MVYNAQKEFFMKKISPKLLSGFMELLPAQQIAFNNMKNTITQTYEKFGFMPMDTPVLESADVLLAKAGGETEKQIYRFEKGEPNQYQYRLEMIDKENGEEYIRYMEEAGIEKIGGYLWWVYFRKRNDGTDFKLFSDVRSRMDHLTRIYNMMNMLRILLTVLLSINYLMAFVAAWLGDRGALVSMFGLIPCVLVAVWLWGGCKSLSYKLQDLQQEQKIHE